MKVALFLVFFLLVFAPWGEAKSSLAYQHYSRGVELASRKKWEDAREKFQSAIDLNPAYVASYIEWARASVMMGKRKEGLEKLSTALAFARGNEQREKVLRERENLSDIFYTNETFQQYQNGLNYLRLDRSSSAVEAIEKALKTEPDNLLVLAAYATALQAEDRPKEALSAVERAFALNDGRKEVRVDLAELSLSQNPERTMQLIQPLLGDRVEERTAWLQAQALSALKRNKEAIDYLRDVSDKHPDWLFVTFWLGKLYSLDANGGWNARKFLMTFRKRTESLVDNEKADTLETKKLKAARAEAEVILARVNQALE